MLSAINQRHLSMLRDISEVSSLCATQTYIWGGLAPDVLSGRFLREHDDVDGFTLNMWALEDQLTALYQQKGYAVSIVKEVHFLRVEYGEARAVFNQLEIDGETAMWRHAGNEGTVYFPQLWLSPTPHRFYDASVFASGVEFEYCIKTRPQLLNPEWKGREKEVAALHWLEGALDDKQIDRLAIQKRIWSHNPYWVRRGYPSG